MRSPVYAWGDGSSVHLWARVDEKQVRVFDPDPEDYPGFAGGIEIDQSVFDALVLFRHAELCRSPKKMRRAVSSALTHAGNFGSYDFLEALGQHPREDFYKQMSAIVAGQESREATS